MPKIEKVIEIIEALAPSTLAQSWDNCGLLVGDETADVSKVLVALDATFDVIYEAINNGCEMILTHHPILFASVKQFNLGSPLGKKLSLLIKNDIAVYSAHTNLDVVENGVSHHLAAVIGLSDQKPMVCISDSAGIGRVGKLPSAMTLKGFVEHVKSVLCLEHVTYAGDLDSIVKTVAVCGGSGMDFVDDARKNGADVYVTGDLKYHSAQEAIENGIALIDATHYATENIIVENLTEYLTEQCERSGIGVIFKASASGRSPLAII